MRTEEISELCRERTGNHEMGDRHQFIYPGIIPSDGFITLTGWAVTVSARSVDPIGVRAIRASAHDSSQIWCPALNDCLKHLYVIQRYAVAESVQIRLSVSEKNITHGHGRTLS